MSLGDTGENIAEKYLKKKGWNIIERNYEKPWGELDIVAVTPNDTLVCVEVKTMKHWPGGLKPEDQMTNGKLEKFQRASQMYAGNHQDLIQDDRGWRMDLVAIVKKGGEFKIRHYKNVV